MYRRQKTCRRKPRKKSRRAGKLYAVAMGALDTAIQERDLCRAHLEAEQDRFGALAEDKDQFKAEFEHLQAEVRQTKLTREHVKRLWGLVKQYTQEPYLGI